jgi:ribosome-binding protein aMBF1 (putative translation factor)
MRFKHVTRGRLLTDAEAAKYAAMRQRAEQEFKAMPTPHPDELHDRVIDVLALWQFIGDLKAAREHKGLSLADLAALTAINPTALSRLENFRNDNPTFRTLARYARAVGKELRLSMVAEENPAAIATRHAKKPRSKAAARPRRRSA